MQRQRIIMARRKSSSAKPSATAKTSPDGTTSPGQGQSSGWNPPSLRGSGGQGTTGQQPANFGEMVRAFLKEAEPNGDGERDRLRALIERLYEDDPKFLLQFLTGYAYGKPADRTESSITVSGVPEKFVELFRQHAKEL